MLREASQNTIGHIKDILNEKNKLYVQEEAN